MVAGSRGFSQSRAICPSSLRYDGVRSIRSTVARRPCHSPAVAAGHGTRFLALTSDMALFAAAYVSQGSGRRGRMRHSPAVPARTIPSAGGTVSGEMAHCVYCQRRNLHRPDLSHSLSSHFLHWTPSAERGSSQSDARCPGFLRGCQHRPDTAPSAPITHLQLRQTFGSMRSLEQSRARWPSPPQLTHMTRGISTSRLSSLQNLEM